MNHFKRYGFLWIVGVLFVSFFTIHWVTAWNSYVAEQNTHNQPIIFDEYLNEAVRQTFENAQSEMLQLILQVGLISVLWFAGSPQSKSEEERLEEEVKFIMRQLNLQEADKVIKELNEKYPKK